MDRADPKPLSYEEKLSSAAERMARRMGGEFVPDKRWSDVVRASQRDVTTR